jgi:peroxin-19
LDDFNKPKLSADVEPSATSGPGRSEPTASTGPTTAPPAGEFDEEAFLKQLEADMMANLMSGAGAGPSAEAGPGGADNPKEANESVDKELEELSKQLKDSGIEPEAFLKSLIAESVLPGDPKGDSNSGGAGAAASADPTAARGSFQDTIRQTMERMQESGERATAAAVEDDVPEDLLAQLLKAVEAGSAAGGDDMDLNKMFMGMMEQLSNKEMLYEPMKELHTKFGPWLEENRTKVSAEDLARYEIQARVVGEIVAKFDEEGYADEKPECRSFIWDRMQEV